MGSRSSPSTVCRLRQRAPGMFDHGNHRGGQGTGKGAAWGRACAGRANLHDRSVRWRAAISDPAREGAGRHATTSAVTLRIARLPALPAAGRFCRRGSHCAALPCPGAPSPLAIVCSSCRPSTSRASKNPVHLRPNPVHSLDWVFFGQKPETAEFLRVTMAGPRSAGGPGDQEPRGTRPEMAASCDNLLVARPS